MCSVSAVLVYLVSRGKKAGPLFILKDGKPLTRQRFVAAIHDALHQAGVATESYASYRIGTATTAASRDLEDYHSDARQVAEPGPTGIHSYHQTPASQLLCTAVLTDCFPKCCGHLGHVFVDCNVHFSWCH